MAGFFSSLIGGPEQAQALGLLGAQMMKGRAADGFLLANQHMATAPQRHMQSRLAEAQLAETLAQAEERKARLAAMERQQLLLTGLLGATGAPTGGSVPGAPSGGATPVAGAPAQTGGAPAGGGGLLGLSQQLGIPVEAIQADLAFNGGKKISELIAERSKPNWQNINGNLVNTNAPGFQGGFQPGMSASNDGRVTMWQPDGRGGVVVGAPRGAIETYGAYQGVGEGTKAAFDPVQVAAPDGSMRFVPRSQVVRPQPAAAGNADADRFAILTQELANAKATGNVRDAAAIEAEISRLAPSARTAASPSGLAVNGTYQATPTSAQAAEAAAAKERAVADAKSASERDAGRAKKSTQAEDMLGYISEARKLLQAGPTSSGVGAVVDGAMGLVGRSTKGGDVAAQLETISGWMVSNVPRMEGPQSNFDVQNYKTMAALVGDKTQPLSRRLAALDTLETLQRKYAHLNEAPAPTGGATGSWDQPLPKPMKGMVRNGYRFKGGDPSSPSSWEKM